MHATLDLQVPMFLDCCPQRATKSGIVLMILKCCLMTLTCCVYVFGKLSNEFEMFTNDLSCSSNNFERGTYKGGGALERPTPFVGLLSHKLFRLVLKS